MRSRFEHPVFLALLGLAGLVLWKESPPPRPHASAPPIADGQRPVAQGGAKPGWWALLKRVAQQVSANQLLTQAAAVTFYALLSIFPAMAAIVSIYGLVADPHTILAQVDALSAVLPGGGQKLLMDELNTLTGTSNQGLGWALAVGVGTSLWTANQAMKALFNALNAVHDVPETRGFFRLTAITLACTAGLVLFLVVALAAVVAAPAVMGWVGLGSVTGQLIAWLRWPILLIAVGLLLATLYRFGPCRSHVVWRWVSWGSAFAAIFWVVISVLFSWYVANFGSYDKTYGSLGAVIGFMTWIWISTTVVLVGAQLDAELEKSTVGQQAPRRSEDVKAIHHDVPSPA